MSDAVVTTIIVQVFAIVGIFVKSWYDKRLSRRELSNRDKLLGLKVNEIQNGLIEQKQSMNDIKAMLEAHIFDNDFQVKFKDEIQKKTAIELKAFTNLNHRKIINHWVEIIEKFGLKYYYSSYRKGNKRELEEFLTNNINIKIDEFDKFVSETITVPKKLGALTLYFNQFIQAKNNKVNTDIMPVHNHTLILIQNLVKNGLSFETTIDLFVNYIKDFISAYHHKVELWSTLNDPEYKDID
jgi:beta-glucosidase/6-phospho-beta-glucosidase/beta-galactosidase